jgi:transposase InsO family protein
MQDQLAPLDHAEAVAQFRAQLVARLAAQELRHGELHAELKRLSQLRHRPPNAVRTRRYGVSTLERWLYAYKNGGLAALRPKRRCDAGHARVLTEAQRALLCDIRREYPSASAELIVRTLEADGRLDTGQVSPATVRRLFRAHALPRLPRRAQHDPGGRRRWEAGRAGHLWHSDVCHGPTLTLDGKRTPLRIHALLDDASRYVVALTVRSTEREVEMLELMTRGLRRFGAPRLLYLDNGSTYTGEMLATACTRLKISLVHARPYDPQARGKMERFWRTLREGCLDHLGEVSRLHDVQARLLAWLDGHYHRAAHGGLMGRSPEVAWADRELTDITESQITQALMASGRRRVRTDGTLSVGGVDWEVEQGFLSGTLVRIQRNLAEPTAAPFVLHEDRRLTLRRVDPKANGRAKRAFTPKPGIDAVAFDPCTTQLDAVLGRTPKAVR